MAFWRTSSLFSSSTPSTATNNDIIGQETVKYNEDLSILISSINSRLNVFVIVYNLLHVLKIDVMLYVVLRDFQKYEIHLFQIIFN